jgi:hypothetical protein
MTHQLVGKGTRNTRYGKAETGMLHYAQMPQLNHMVQNIPDFVPIGFVKITGLVV